ncbi:glycoside hydrolase family 35 protein [Abortiporus biennis]|nr:glycoside hydrolase family 35 protein [Abortiporus biennis]
MTLQLILNIFLCILLTTRVLGQLSVYDIPPGSPGFQHGNSSQAVQFDSHSLFIDGRRIFLFGGEFHPWRLPVPQLWSDILQKMKAANFNAVSIYVHWGLVEGKSGELNWEYHRSLEEFYKVAQRVGIFVIARPGPYINAETTGGGLPGWLTNIADVARTNQTGYVNAWQSYIKDFAQMTSRYQYPNGPVIAVQSENEFYVSGDEDPTSTEYMVLLEKALRENGIDKVPITANDVYPSGNFAKGLGEVDLYGFDSYPNGFDCAHPPQWSELANYYISGHQNSAPWAPVFFPEFQGGALDGWQGVGYDGCEQLTGPEFANVFYKNNVASGSTAMSFYMIYGGTNWGNILYPGVYTSYDYGSAIREDRLLSPKYDEVKLQGMFYHASPQLLTSSILASGQSQTYTSNSGVFTSVLGLPEGPTKFYVVRQNSNNVTTPTSFLLNIDSSVGQLTIPQLGGHITLAGRESKILVTDYAFGSNFLQYSTAEVLTHTTIDSIDYVVLYVLPGQSFEASFGSTSINNVNLSGSPSVQAKVLNGSVVLFGTLSSSTTALVRFGNTAVLVVDKFTATSIWNPRTIPSFDLSPDTPSILVKGPYVVRNATIIGSTLELVGDTNRTTSILVVAPSTVRSVHWNGSPVSMTKSNLGIGLTGTIPGPVPSLSLPNLKSLKWRTADSLPEVAMGFDDSQWVVANKTEVARSQKPFYGKVVLFADEYGFHSGSFIFRGSFTGGKSSAVQLSLQGGSYFGYSAFINGHFLGSNQGFNGSDIVNATYSFLQGTLNNGRNVLTIVMDSNGLDTDWNANDAFKNPRGIRGYQLIGGSGDFDSWKLTGNLGGEDFPDKVRGPLNEGGFWAERSGAVLPGFDDSKWALGSPFVGIPKAGVQVYRTSFALDIPLGTDASLGFQFTRAPTSNYRSLLFVNGWQFGKFISNFGPQTVFPIPEGVLNHHGMNEIALTLWSLDSSGAKIADLKLVPLGVLSSGKEVVTDAMVSPTYQDLRGPSN